MALKSLILNEEKGYVRELLVFFEHHSVLLFLFEKSRAQYPMLEDKTYLFTISMAYEIKLNIFFYFSNIDFKCISSK